MQFFQILGSYLHNHYPTLQNQNALINKPTTKYKGSTRIPTIKKMNFVEFKKGINLFKKMG